MADYVHMRKVDQRHRAPATLSHHIGNDAMVPSIRKLAWLIVSRGNGRLAEVRTPGLERCWEGRLRPRTKSRARYADV